MAGEEPQHITQAPNLFNPTQVTNVEAEDIDYDSAIDDSGQQSELTSISSSVFNYVYENGRRYHSNRFDKGKYFMPNDEGEQERLDLYHHIFLTILGGRLYQAPLPEQIHHVLDVGTGTGIWAIDMAEEHPEAEVIGTDISPIQPSWVPSNCRFEVDDMEEEWAYKKDSFDYIHMRSLSGCFRNWDHVVEQAFDHLKPGGWAEFQDYGCEVFYHTGQPVAGGSKPLPRYFDLLVEAAAQVGRPLVVGRLMKERLIRAGFVNVEEHVAIWPLGEWPKDKALKELGKWGRVGAFESAEPFALQLLCNVKGWSKEDVIKLCNDVKKDLLKGKYYCQAWFVYGQKPVEK